jgi:hypothetical protein
MTSNQDTMKFWTVLAGTILVVAVMVMLIDMSIKAAILGESNELRLVIERERNGRGKAESNSSRASDNRASSSPLLGFDATGVETGNVANGHKATPAKSRASRQPKNQGGAGEIPPGN